MSKQYQDGYPREDTAPAARAAQTIQAAGTPGVVHHWVQGPQDVERINRAGTRWRFRWYLERVEGLGRREALRAIYGVLNDPRGWKRTNIQFVRTLDPAKANIRLAVVTRGGTVCGASAVGCYSGGNGGKPLAEVEAEYLRDPLLARIVLGMEICGHGCLRILDGYTTPHQPYGGVLGTWQEARAVDGYPTAWEIEAAKVWLRGETPAGQIHND